VSTALCNMTQVDVDKTTSPSSEARSGNDSQDNSNDSPFLEVRIDSLAKIEMLSLSDWNDEGDDADFSLEPSRRPVCSLPEATTSSSCVLERFSNDVSALILSHLDLQEIATVSLVSKSFYHATRSNTLWKHLITNRWNISDNLDNYFTAYQQAHAHPHDLWISHWNCVFPHEALAPGRCFISKAPSEAYDRRNTRVARRLKPFDCCPNCRDWNDFDRLVSNDSNCPIQANTLAEIVALATSSTRRRCSGCLVDCIPLVKSRAKYAFGCAGTFHRKLRVEQYEAGPCNFLTDLLFFNLTDPATEQGQWELEQLLREAQEQNDGVDLDTDLALYETCHHTWQVCRLFNPDLYRPILYQIGVQRPDCFTVYPSEGYIEPGDTVYLTIGVRPLGSALSYAFEALNVQRDGLPAAWADLYTEQAHLPMAPILVRYQFASAPPCSAAPSLDPLRRPTYENFSGNTTTMPGQGQQVSAIGTDVKSRKQVLLDFHCHKPVPTHQIRSIHLSAHVHSHYTFLDFQKDTCHAWDLHRDYNGPLFVAPALMENYPVVYHKLQDVPADVYALGKVVAAQTEGPCLECGHTWGVREEEMAQAYMVCQAEIADHIERRIFLLDNVIKCVNLLCCGLVGDASNLSTMLRTISHVLQCFKASPWTSLKQKRMMLQLEAMVDDAYRQIPVGGENWIPWRLAGVYKYAVSTDSVFQGHILESDTIDADFMDEPDYLDAFRHLAHSPGRYCLGAQEDPNHLEETNPAILNRYKRVKKGFVTDIFMDDPVSAFQAGICMMRDARSLLVHGIHDRIRYPGSIVRRPKLLIFESFSTRNATCGDLSLRTSDALLKSAKTRRKFIFLQNAFAVDDIFGVDGRSGLNNEDESILESLSLQNYVRGVPPPGVGRFPLSQELSSHDFEAPARIVALEVGDEVKREDVNPSDNQQDGRIEAAHRLRPQFPANMPGPRAIQLLWILGAQLGLAVIDSPGVASVFVDRTILIASQWVSISLMAAPLFWTLCARYAQLIPAQPVDYTLEGLPFSISNKMRFLNDSECGYVAILVLFVWLALGRYTERHLHRDFFRVLLEHVTPLRVRCKQVLGVPRFMAQLSLCVQRIWDSFCPLFLQRRVFAPHWNRRSTSDLMKHIAFWRSRNLSQPVVARPGVRIGDSLFGDVRDEGVDVGGDYYAGKIVIGTVVAWGSFCSSSPHFWLNLVTVFSCSISLGMSVSLRSMEKGTSSVNLSSTGAFVKEASLASVVILAFLVGQLIGSSGGTMFLAEFVVTSISLLLGGGSATISSSAMESWGCFFCLSATAFWGYLFGRVALMDGIRRKRGGFSSVLLSKAVVFLFFFWLLVFLISKWDAPVSLMIVRPSATKDVRNAKGRYSTKLLQ
jgi:hypothetical protein